MASDSPTYSSKPLPKLFRFGDFILAGCMGSALGMGVLFLINDVQLRRPKRGAALLCASILSMVVWAVLTFISCVALVAFVPDIPVAVLMFIGVVNTVLYNIALWLGVKGLYGHEFARREGTSRLGRRPLALCIGFGCSVALFAAFIAGAKIIHSMGGLEGF